jgi:hypothetical protein
MKDMEFLDAVRLAPERAPVKRPPVSILQVNQNNQNEENRDAG